jgi:hypothetical protein
VSPPLFSFDEDGFRAAVSRHWLHQTPAKSFHWFSVMDDEGTLHVIAAPVNQEILGGPDDGATIWPGFELNLNGLIMEEGLQITSLGAGSASEVGSDHPYVELLGQYRGDRFQIKILLEPIGAVRETIDAVTHDVRPIEEQRE